MRNLLIALTTLLLGAVASAANPSTTSVDDPTAASLANKKIRYKKGKDLNFDNTLVEGQVYRPDLSVVTGDAEMDSNGALRIRQSFADRTANESGEEVQ